MNQHRGHVNEFGGDVYVQFAKLLNISEILSCDLGDWNVVNVDVLLANEVKQQVERAFIDAGYGN
jgi:hypothetical protein